MDGLYTRRNISECLGAAWTLLSTNIHRMVRSLWLSTLSFSVFYALLAVALLGFVKNLSLGKSLTVDVVAVVVFSVAVIVTTLVIIAKIFNQVNTLDFKHCIQRSCKAFLIVVTFCVLSAMLLVAAVIVSIYLMQNGKMSLVASYAVMGILTLAIAVIPFVFFCPFNYSLTKYMVEPDMSIKQIWKNYRVGFRNMGFVFGCSLLCIVIMVTIYNVMALSGYVATISASLAYSGALNGDSVNLPEYFPIIFGATMFVAGLISTVLLVWFVFVEYYQYASIEARNGRTDSKQNKQTK